MGSIWVEGLASSFEQALDLLEAAVRDCAPVLWETPMWPVPAPDTVVEVSGPGGTRVTEPLDRLALVQRWSTPWAVAWHALECLDYDLGGEFAPWAPPPPFTGHPHWRDLTRLPVAWTQPEILGYIDYCQGRVRAVLAEMSDEKASRLLPQAHRHHGQPHARVIAGLVVHTTEHAAQVRQFITASGTTADE